MLNLCMWKTWEIKVHMNLQCPPSQATGSYKRRIAPLSVHEPLENFIFPRMPSVIEIHYATVA